MRRGLLVPTVVLPLLLVLAACGGEEVPQAAAGRRIVEPAPAPRAAVDDPGAADNACLTCHEGIEGIRCSSSGMFAAILERARASGTDNRCIVCHGGDPDARREDGSERGSPAYEALAARAHRETAPWFRENPGPKDFYPDPGSPWINEHTCGVCHVWEVRVQWRSLMMTEAGKIQGTVWGFGGAKDYEHVWANYDVSTLPEDEQVGTESYHAYMAELASKEPQVFHSRMEQLPAAPTGAADVREDPSRSAFTYIRGECQRCHLAVGGMQRHGDYRGLGCSACHVPYSNSGLYEGDDPTLADGKAGRPLVHSIQAGPGAPVTAGDTTWSGIPVETCTTCHNRGRRIGVSYQGLMETPYASPWTAEGKPQQKLHGKTYIKLHADLHADKGFLCQDCHTTLDVHSSGRLVGAITAAVEIECVDCHGTPLSFPWELPLGTMDEYTESPKNGPARGLAEHLPSYMEKGDYPPPADGYLLTSRGNPLGNAVRQGRHVEVHLASGAVHELKPLKTLAEDGGLSVEARVAMVQVDSHMERMECYACHATWAPQCYGCHIKVDYSKPDAHWDWVAIGHDHQPDGTTPEYTERAEKHRIPGEIVETRSYLRWEDPALAQNGEGRIAPVVPGCQTTVTLVGEDGQVILGSHIFRIPNVEGAGAEGQLGIDHSPLHPHTVQKRARTCESCHANPKALGYGIGSGAFYADPSKDHVVDLMTGDGQVIPKNAPVQMTGIPDLAMDWSRFVSEDGKQLQTVGHHLRLSRPLTSEERRHMTREGTCLACHQEIPKESLAVSLLHHVADAIDMLPKSNEDHAGLIHKTTLLAAWGQVLGAACGGLFGLVAAWWWLRRRGRRRALRA